METNKNVKVFQLKRSEEGKSESKYFSSKNMRVLRRHINPKKVGVVSSNPLHFPPWFLQKFIFRERMKSQITIFRIFLKSFLRSSDFFLVSTIYVNFSDCLIFPFEKLTMPAFSRRCQQFFSLL